VARRGRGAGVTVERAVSREAHAKLNVFLRVLGAREDGYHELESLVLPISLADTIVARSAPRLQVEIKGDASLAEAVGAGGMNLGLVAALALAEACGLIRGAEITITKRIPVAAGLGGGSADAAATLLALNELWSCELGQEALLGIAERVGSDVPALLLGRPVLMRGRGEHVEPIEVAPTWWVVRPFPFGTRSPDAYRWWDEDGARTGAVPERLLQAAVKGELAALGAALANDLEAPVVARHPEIGEVRDALLEAGALGAMMSGSGPTVVALARDRDHAEALADTQPESIVATGPPRH
jgi:4-diphosphocytidyl-2-C-methyl-D-erythritol kinase